MANNYKYKMVDLFAGCGGLSCGLEQAGFTPWFVNEIVETFCNTYKKNHELSDDHYYVGDINELNNHIDEYKEYLSDITLVCGGPPCQGFSMANRQRILDDPRNQLYKAYLTFLSHVRPKFFIMENVKGMANKIEEIKQNFKDFLGDEYQFDYMLLRAQDYGVPQNRERFIMIGNCMGIDPKDIFEEIYKQKRPAFTLHDALEGLPHLEARKEKGAKDIENEQSGFTVRDFEYVDSEFYHFINGDRKITKLYNHKNRYNNERDIEIYRRLPQGANSLHESIADFMPYSYPKVSDYYTPYLLSELPAQAAIKTGTPQMTSAEDTGSAFVGFYPSDDPVIAFSGFVEHGEYSKFMVRQIIEAYYNKNYEPADPVQLSDEELAQALAQNGIYETD